MSTFVLVHGAFSGAWCWERVVHQLEELGHKVVAVNLPSHGNDGIAPSTVTLEQYVEYLRYIVSKERGEVILVGHSLGGIVISQTAESIPSKITKLVYVAALLPQSGQSFMELNERNQKALPLPITVSEDQGHFKLDINNIRENFYGETQEEDYLFAKEKHCDQPLAPFITPVSLTQKNYGSISRVYIETLKDKSLSHEFQREMITHMPCDEVHSLDSDHSPFFSKTEELVQLLHSLAE